MAIFYREGETKTRPGVYQRYSNVDSSPTPGAQDGICAIPIRASWEPLGKVVRNSYGELTKNYGSGDYDAQCFTVPAAQEMFNGSATTVYTYRMRTGGKKSSLTLKAVLTEQIFSLIAAGFTQFLSGMAEGTDCYCTQIVLGLREKNPAMKLHCIIPHKGQADKWSVSSRECYNSILEQADSIVDVNRTYHKDCMLERNRFLVDHTAMLLAL